jgi:outer membrane receptor protein involved in Fe transport
MAGFEKESWRDLRVAATAFAILPLCIFPELSSAQDETPDATDETIEEIVVIGSRLRRRDYSSPSPIATIDRETLYATGQGTLETAISQMPQFTPDLDRTANNPGNGRAFINLRGLGPGRTLVMLNGRRLAPSGIGAAVDLNNLPQALIESIEIISGGASAVYGSDAVSGVVNFVLREDFEGIGVDMRGYVTEEGDSSIYDINVAYGHNFASGRGNITVFGGYYDRVDTYADARAFTSVPWGDSIFSGQLEQIGSPNVPDGAVFFPPVDYGNGPSSTIFDANGDPREFVEPDDLYNYAPENYLQIPLRRYNAGFFLRHELTDGTEAYAEVSYSRSEVERILAPVPRAEFLAVNFDNPVLTNATSQLFADNLLPAGPDVGLGVFSRRFEEFGPRINDTTSEYTRLLTGVRGEIGSDWAFDAWFTYTKNDESDDFLNDGSISRWQQGLLVDPATGQCFDPSNGCVPVNMFGAGNLSPEAVEFLRQPPLGTDTSREQIVASGFVRGPLAQGWAGPIETVVGAEWRRDDGSFVADSLLSSGDSMTFGDNPFVDVIGEEQVAEVFAELLLPLVAGAPLVDYLALELGARYSRYENAGTTDTYKAGLDWSPVPGLRFRGMYQRSMRAPDLFEAFQEQTVTQDFFVSDDPRDDPCSASSDPVANNNVDSCVATGLPPEQIGVFEASTFPTLFIGGGNPDLEPEIADTVTIGLVATPPAMPNLQFSIDYVAIDIDGEIGELAAVDVCFDPANVDSVYCDQIIRDPLTYNVAEIREFRINRGVFKTSGLDTQLTYSTELPPALTIGNSGSLLTVDIVWSHVYELTRQNTSFGSKLDCAGTFGWPCYQEISGMTWPKDRVMTRLRYDSGSFSADLNWRWISSTANGAYVGAPLIGIPVSDLDLAVPEADARNYVDLSLAYRFSENIVLGLTVANLTDTDPPMMADWVWDKNTDTRMYDIFGRSYTLSLFLTY